LQVFLELDAVGRLEAGQARRQRSRNSGPAPSFKLLRDLGQIRNVLELVLRAVLGRTTMLYVLFIGDWLRVPTPLLAYSALTLS
jgi:hypothetical protein